MNATTVVHAVGFNGYGQLDPNKDSPRIINRFSEIRDCTQEDVILIPLWSRILIAKGRTLIVSPGSVSGRREFGFESSIQSVAANEELGLILLDNNELWRVNLSGDCLPTKLNVLSIEGSPDEDYQQGKEVPQFITSTLREFYAITSSNSVYALPTKIGALPGDRKVIQFVSGFEHCLALLGNGDIFSWGGGLKGQLGIGELGDAEEPTLIEALSGIKIIRISAGGWHSCAISEFGDLYAWGWNKQGQLGIPVKHNRSIYLLPEIVDVILEESGDPEEIQTIACGSSHSIVLTGSGKLLGTGNCAFGQLCITSPSGFIDQYLPISAPNPSVTNVMCGSMSSFVLSRATL